MKLSDVPLRFVESYTRLQATLDRACTEISDAVKAIDERNKNSRRPWVACAWLTPPMSRVALCQPRIAS